MENWIMKQLKQFSTLMFAVLLASMLGCAGGPQKESTAEYVDDSIITTKVKSAILQEPSLKVAEINVETFKGRVQLSGFVKSRADMSKAVEVARSVGGVTSVANDMRIK
jgi:osmotically-inducible protein OsmY